MGRIQRDKVCEECHHAFTPTGANCKRCEPCRRDYHLKYCKKRWHDTYEKKGRNQKGANNNAWKGGNSPQYYQSVAFALYGDKCARCGGVAVLVHHKDGNRKNSTGTNLEVLCKRCHQLEHNCTGNLPKKVVFKSKCCDSCNRVFKPTGPRSKLCASCRE